MRLASVRDQAAEGGGMIPIPVSIPELRCACGSDQVMCFDPGDIEVREQDILLKRERPFTARCLQCLIGAPATAEATP